MTAPGRPKHVKHVTLKTGRDTAWVAKQLGHAVA